MLLFVEKLGVECERPSCKLIYWVAGSGTELELSMDEVMVTLIEGVGI